MLSKVPWDDAVGGRIVPVLAVVLTVATLVSWLRQRSFFARAQLVQGRVVQNEVRQVRRSRRRRPMVFPIVEFQADGHTFQLSGSVGASRAVHELGAQVPVFFMPGDAENAVLGTKEEKYFMPMMFGIFAVVAWIVVVMLQFVGHR